MLDELDRELERRGHRFVRYADDSKSAVAKPQERRFLGFNFTSGKLVKRGVSARESADHECVRPSRIDTVIF